MRGEQLSANDLLASTPGAPADTALQRLKGGTRLGLSGWSCRKIGEAARDGDGSPQALRNLQRNLRRPGIRGVGNRDDAHLEALVASAQHESAWTRKQAQVTT